MKKKIATNGDLNNFANKMSKVLGVPKKRMDKIISQVLGQSALGRPEQRKDKVTSKTPK